MRHGQIKALPRELVTPVGLLMQETRVFDPSRSPRYPRTRNASSKCSRTDKRRCSHHLMRPQIVFGMTRPLPPVWFLLRHELPAEEAVVVLALWIIRPDPRSIDETLEYMPL